MFVAEHVLGRRGRWWNRCCGRRWLRLRSWLDRCGRRRCRCFRRGWRRCGWCLDRGWRWGCRSWARATCTTTRWHDTTTERRWLLRRLDLDARWRGVRDHALARSRAACVFDIARTFGSRARRRRVRLRTSSTATSLTISLALRLSARAAFSTPADVHRAPRAAVRMEGSRRSAAVAIMIAAISVRSASAVVGVALRAGVGFGARRRGRPCVGLKARLAAAQRQEHGCNDASS